MEEKKEKEDAEEDRLSILEKVERGEISIEEAEAILKEVSDETEPEIAEEKAIEEIHEDSKPTLEQEREKKLLIGEFEETDVPTRRERKLSLAERFQNWQPRMMIKATEKERDAFQWPWENEDWQWMWQNLDYPVYISHSADVSSGTELKVVSYQGDLFIRGWDKPMLGINGAVFDLRVAQDEKNIRIASSTGQIHLWVPDSIARVEAVVKPGDMWISNMSTDIDAYCQSGDLSCQHVKGNIEARVNGGDARLMEIEGSIYVNTIRGNSKVRDIFSDNVTLKATEGDICLNLRSISSGRFRCENDKGDIDLLTDGELACEMLMEATMGGRIAPVMLPWQRLLERSEGKMHGILKGGGAYISLITQSGNIYIQESWINTFPIPSVNA